MNRALKFVFAVGLGVLANSAQAFADESTSPQRSNAGRKLAIALPKPKSDVTVRHTTPLALTSPKGPVALNDLFPQTASSKHRPALGSPLTPPAELTKVIADAGVVADQLARSSSFGAPAQALSWTISSVRQWNSLQMTPFASPHLAAGSSFTGTPEKRQSGR